MGEHLRASLRDAPVVRKGTYDYFVHPLCDGVPPLDPALLEEVVEEVLDVADLQGATKVLTCEAMGLPLATAVSLRTGIPLAVVRKRAYGLPGEVAVAGSTGYGESTLHVNAVEEGDRVVVLDDVMSTGGTLDALLTALGKIGATVQDTVVVFEKGPGKALLEERHGTHIKTLLRVTVEEGRVLPLEDGDA